VYPQVHFQFSESLFQFDCLAEPDAPQGLATPERCDLVGGIPAADVRSAVPPVQILRASGARRKHQTEKMAARHSMFHPSVYHGERSVCQFFKWGTTARLTWPR
jgi:hypothetical protein